MVKAKKQGEYHWDKGDVAWSPPPPKKKRKDYGKKRKPNRKSKK